jgi:hypothetical protein
MSMWYILISMRRYVKSLLTRVILLLLALGAAIIFEPIFDYLLTHVLHYKSTPFYFGSTEALIIAPIFFMGVIFEIRGRKFEFGWIILFLVAAFILLTQMPNPGLEKYTALIGAGVAGNAIGYILKLVRERILVGGHRLGKI